MEEESYLAVVQGVYPKGKHGPYAVASSKFLGPITFALEQKVWIESSWPEPGTFVVLSQIIRKSAGWRAQKGRFMRPFDERKGDR